MRTETQKALKTGQARIKETAKAIKKEVAPSWLEKQLVRLYLKSPSKVQYALAKYGVKRAIKKKKADLEHMLKH